MWATIAEALVGSIGLERLNTKAVKVLRDRIEEPFVVACSGGADSVALLLIVWGVLSRARERMVVAHFNHRLRGADADADEAFTSTLAKSLGVTFRSGAWADAPTRPSESAAREARRQFLESVCEASGSRTLLTGHHLDDVGETVLMRLARGSGVEGLSAPRPVAKRTSGLTLVRPLIDLPKVELTRLLREAGAHWREDNTNKESLYFRNRLRNEVIPRLDLAAGRSFSAAAARSRRIIEEVDDLLNALANDLLRQAEQDTPSDADSSKELSLYEIREAPIAVARRVMEIWLARAGLRENLSAAAFEHLLGNLIAGREGCCSAGSVLLRYDRDRLRLLEEAKASGSYRASTTMGVEVHFPWGGALTLRRVRLTAQQLEDVLSGRAVSSHFEAFLKIPPDAVLTVRNWGPGDAFQPLGAPGRMKLKDQFINRKIPAAERARLPVVCYDDSIAWCAGLPPAEKFKLDSRTQEVGWLTYRNA